MGKILQQFQFSRVVFNWTREALQLSQQERGAGSYSGTDPTASFQTHSFVMARLNLPVQLSSPF